MRNPHLAALAAVSDEAFRIILVTRSGIIDGYARWELTRGQSRKTIACLEYDMSHSTVVPDDLLCERQAYFCSAFDIEGATLRAAE